MGRAFEQFGESGCLGSCALGREIVSFRAAGEVEQSRAGWQPSRWRQWYQIRKTGPIQKIHRVCHIQAGHCVWSPKFQLEIVRMSGYIPLRQTCFETFPLLVNERERLLSHPFRGRSVRMRESRGGTYGCIGSAHVGVRPVSVCFCVCSAPWDTGLWRERHL